MPGKFNTRVTEWETCIAPDGKGGGVWASCVWDATTQRRHMDLRYYTARGKATRHYILLDTQQAALALAALERFKGHVATAPLSVPCVVRDDD